MKLFLHTMQRVRIMNGEQEWTGTPDEFQQCEPDYPGLPVLTQAPAVTRYQTPEWKYIEDSMGKKHADTIDCLGYCDNIAAYVLEPPALWVHADLTKALLCASDPSDTIPFAIAMRMGPDAADPLAPISATWPIALRQKNGLAMDNILLTFVDGQASGAYTYDDSLPLGEWYIDEQDFAAVPFGDRTYVVKLAHDVRFTVYRNL